MDEPRRTQDSAELPSTYGAQRTVDLKRDKGLAVAVQAVFVLVALLAVGVALLAGPSLRTDWSPVLTITVTLLACLLYMWAHEATHGLVLQALTRARPTYAVRFPFLTTGNRAYLTRRSAVVVALAPCVVWGIVLVVALLVLPQQYLLTAYIVLALNFAGSAGDYVEVYVVSQQQHDALVQDDGDRIHVFAPTAAR